MMKKSVLRCTRRSEAFTRGPYAHSDLKLAFLHRSYPRQARR